MVYYLIRFWCFITLDICPIRPQSFRSMASGSQNQRKTASCCRSCCVYRGVFLPACSPVSLGSPKLVCVLVSCSCRTSCSSVCVRMVISPGVHLCVCMWIRPVLVRLVQRPFPHSNPIVHGPISFPCRPSSRDHIGPCLRLPWHPSWLARALEAA